MKLSTSKCGKYRVESVSAAAFNGALETIRGFCQEETFCVGCELNLNPAVVEEFLAMCADVALDGMTLLCVCADTGHVVAAAFNKLKFADEGSYFKKFRGRFKEPSTQNLIKTFINDDNECDLFQKYNVDCSFEIMFLSTLRKHRRKGLGALLMQDSLYLAGKLQDGPVSTITVQDLGPKYSGLQARPINTKMAPKICYAFFTSEKSQALGKRFGFKVESTMSFDNVFYNGKSYAARIGTNSSFC